MHIFIPHMMSFRDSSVIVIVVQITVFALYLSYCHNDGDVGDGLENKCRSYQPLANI